MAETLFSHNPAIPVVLPSSSRSRPHAGRIATGALLGFSKVTAVRVAARRASLLVRAMPLSGEDAAGRASEASSDVEKASNISHKLGGLNLSLGDVPVWARWVLGSIVVVAVPFYKKFLRMEDEVEKTVETAVEVAEEVAKVTKKVVSDLAESLPADGSLRKIALEVEEIAEVVITDSEKTKSFILKVDEIKEEVEAAVEPIIKEGDIFGKKKK